MNILAGASARNAANVNCSFLGNSLGVCAAIAATNAASAPAPLNCTGTVSLPTGQRIIGLRKTTPMQQQMPICSTPVASRSKKYAVCTARNTIVARSQNNALLQCALHCATARQNGNALLTTPIASRDKRGARWAATKDCGGKYPMPISAKQKPSGSRKAYLMRFHLFTPGTWQSPLSVAATIRKDFSSCCVNDGSTRPSSSPWTTIMQGVTVSANILPMRAKRAGVSKPPCHLQGMTGMISGVKGNWMNTPSLKRAIGVICWSPKALPRKRASCTGKAA